MPASAAAATARLSPAMASKTGRRTLQSTSCCMCVQRPQTPTTQRPRWTKTVCRQWSYTSWWSRHCLVPCSSWQPSMPTYTSGHSDADVCSWQLRHPSSERTVNDDDEECDAAVQLQTTTGPTSRTDDLGWRCVWSQPRCSPAHCRTE